MSEFWIGKAVSIKCVNDFGIFQGTIKDANSAKIVISRAFRNGLPLKTPDTEVTISAKDIVKISLIPSQNASNVNNGMQNMAPQFEEQNFNKINVGNKEIKSANKSPPNHFNQMNLKSKSPVCMNNAFGNFIPAKVEVKLAHSGASSASHNNSSVVNNNNNNTSNNSTNTSTNTKHIRILQRNDSQANDTLSQASNGVSTHGKASGGSAPQQLMQQFNKNDRKKQYRPFNENVTFGTPVDDPVMGEDFDFEKNLALFDKQAIWDKIDANQKPQVKQTGQVNKKTKNYRHDENILAQRPATFRQITVKENCSQEYVTDDGIIIPTISSDIRSRIQLQAEVFGFDWQRQCDMLSRSTVELALQMLGGARRLSLKNQHQWPKIGIVCDEMCNERHSELGFSTGRHLASQGLQVHILVKPNLSYALQSNREAELFKATGNVITMSVEEMPSCDLIILSLPKPLIDVGVSKWVTDSRSPLMAIDPPVSGISNLAVKCSILPILPLENISASCGKLYLSNLAIPDKFYRDAGINYKSPFGHKFVIPLHLMNENDATKSDNEMAQA